jgi:hypothetical protein
VNRASRQLDEPAERLDRLEQRGRSLLIEGDDRHGPTVVSGVPRMSPSAKIFFMIATISSDGSAFGFSAARPA